MRNELVTVGIALLLVAGLPAAMAHSDGNTDLDDPTSVPSVGSPTQSPENTLVFDDRPATSGVSGDFVAPGGVYVGAPDPVGLIAIAVMLCDLEVLSDGNSNGAVPGDEVQDETTVDAASNPGGLQADGTWDDGGVGGACHTDANTYADSGYNTPGCGGTVRGDHLLHFGVDPFNFFVFASCDDAAAGGQGLATCLANTVAQQDPDRLLPPDGECYAIATNPAPPPGTVASCGSDGTGDAGTSGYVNDNGPVGTFWSAPSTGTGLCSSSDESLALFAMLGVDARGGPNGGAVGGSFPIMGWVST